MTCSWSWPWASCVCAQQTGGGFNEFWIWIPFSKPKRPSGPKGTPGRSVEGPPKGFLIRRSSREALLLANRGFLGRKGQTLGETLGTVPLRPVSVCMMQQVPVETLMWPNYFDNFSHIKTSKAPKISRQHSSTAPSSPPHLHASCPLTAAANCSWSLATSSLKASIDRNTQSNNLKTQQSRAHKDINCLWCSHTNTKKLFNELATIWNNYRLHAVFFPSLSPFFLFHIICKGHRSSTWHFCTTTLKPI